MENIIINMPSEAKTIIDILEHDGYEAYIVGGCVRDSLMGKVPHDWDICTSALPEQVMESFKTCEIIPTGLKHGTVTIIINGKPYEVTTYRIDGEYKDNRRPESVEFVSDLRKDLERRDFTINAMAYNPIKGLVDLFGGQEDIKNKVIRCVGDADSRFKEDALRIMRAIRFAVRFGFNIESETEKGLHNNIDLLKNISIERITSEFTQILECPYYSSRDKERLFTACLCVEKVLGQSIFSKTDVSRLLFTTNSSLSLRLAVLFNCDMTKVENLLTAMRFPNNVVDRAIEIRKIGLRLVSTLEFSDISYTHCGRLQRHEVKYCSAIEPVIFAEIIDPCDYAIFRALKNEILYSEYHNDPVSLKDLAVNGDDLLELGITGPDIKNTLEQLLFDVMSDNVINIKEDLINKIKENKNA